MWGSGFFSVRRRRPRLMITFKAEQKKTFSPSVLALCTSSDTSLSFISTQCLLSQTWEVIKNVAATGKHFTAAMFRSDPDWVGCLTGVDGRSSSDLFAAQWARKELLKFTWNKKHMDFPSLLLTKNKTGKITTDVFSQSSLTALRKSRYLWSAHIVSRRLQNPLTPVMLTFTSSVKYLRTDWCTHSRLPRENLWKPWMSADCIALLIHWLFNFCYVLIKL